MWETKLSSWQEDCLDPFTPKNISPKMLKNLVANMAILGHSENRIAGETRRRYK